MPSPHLLDETLRTVERRYRLPPLDASVEPTREPNAAMSIALAIEEARKAIESNAVPAAESKRRFVEALARMIRDAMRPDSGDFAFQAMVLRHRVTAVREYASLSAQSAQDRRIVRAAVIAIAHPQKQARMQPGAHREALARLHAAMASASAPVLRDTVQSLLDAPAIGGDASLLRALASLRDNAALNRLLRAEALEPDALVQRYRSLWERNGPRSGSTSAIADGVAAKQRGADAEASAARALDVLARRLNDDEAHPARYRVVTSMRVPSTLAAGHAHAKTEWDAVLLRRAGSSEAAWDVCLLVEAKASVDAATTDLPRLLRGLRLLARADTNVDYAFDTQQGVIDLSGASLAALSTDAHALARTVLYCCDSSDETAVRVLSAASRMRLMTAQASLDFASASTAGIDQLEPVWHALLTLPQWTAVLRQYPTLREVRELMIHPDDLRAAVARIRD